jgi:hypothetical protein
MTVKNAIMIGPRAGIGPFGAPAAATPLAEMPSSG